MSIVKDFKNTKPSRFLLGMLVLILVIMVPVMSTLDTNSGNSKTAKITSTPINPIDPPPKGFNGIFITCNITNIDLAEHVFKTNFILTPIGNVAVNGNDPIFKRPNVTINVIFGSKLVTFSPFVPMANQDIQLPITIGNINRYPFDSFATDFILYANTVSDVINEVPREIPVAFAIVGAIQAWRTDIDVGIESITNSQFVRINVVSVRSFTVQFFSLFIVACMWLLSFTIFTLATTLWFRDRAVEPPTIGLCASLLFALPAIRSTQPGVPPIGCTVDLAGFFWNMFLVMVSTCLLMTNYIVKYQRVKPKPDHPFYS
jgi:hypothetical protein